MFDAFFHGPQSLHKTIGDRAFPDAAVRVWNMLPPATITSLPSLQTFKRALKTEPFCTSYDNAHYRQRQHNAIDTSLIRYCGPEVTFKTCVAVKFVDDDDDDDRCSYTSAPPETVQPFPQTAFLPELYLFHQVTFAMGFHPLLTGIVLEVGSFAKLLVFFPHITTSETEIKNF